MKAVTVVLLWLLGSAAAIGVAWSGVGVLDDDLVAPAPAVVDADGRFGVVSESVEPFDGQASSPLSSDRSTSSTVYGDSITSVDDRSSSSTSTTSNRTRSTTEGTARGATTGSTATTATTPPTSTTNAGAGGSGSTSPSTATTAAPQPERYETKTFILVGGSTAIRFSPSSTKVLWATPNPGYEVRIEPESEGIKVEFRSDDHRSRIDAWWSNGPRHEIREED